MKVYLITYDLRKPGQDYAKLHEAIKGIGAWAHPMESAWLVYHSGNADKLVAYLRQFIDANDYLLVTHVTSDVAWWLPKSCSDWANQKLFGVRLAA